MSKSPEEFANLYRVMKVNCIQRALAEWGLGFLFNSGVVTVDVQRYRLGWADNRNKIRHAMGKFLEKESGDPESGIVKLKEKAWAVTGVLIDPITLIDDDSINRAMTGKASPGEFVDVLRVASLMFSDGTHTKALLGCKDLPTFVDWFFGQDCNGFAGNYVKWVTGSTAGYQESSCSALSKGTARGSVDEIKERDFIYHDSSPQHIAVIGSITERTGKQIVCNVSEARSFEFGGVQTNVWKIRKATSGWAMNRGGADRMVTSISHSALMPL